jgi:hypothetical protein
MTNQPGKAKPPSTSDMALTTALVVGLHRTSDPTGTVLALLLEALQADPAAPAGDVLNRIGYHTAEDLWRVVQVCTTAASSAALLWATDKNNFGDKGGSAYVVDVARMWRPIPPPKAPA